MTPEQIEAGDDETHRAICAQAAGMLDRGCISHNHLWFHRDAMDAWLRVGNHRATLDHATMLETYSAKEPLPWTDCYVQRGRAMAALIEDESSLAARAQIEGLIAYAEEVGLLGPVPMMEAALAGGDLPI